MKINGNLVMNADGSGTIQNAYFESGAANPGTVAQAGRLFYNTTNGSFSFSTGVNTWSDPVVTTDITDTISTDVANLQVEVDAMQLASGNIYNVNGTYNPAILDALSNVSSSTDLADALSQLNTAIDNAAGIDTLPELTDVNITSLATGHVLYSNDGTNWANAAPGATSGVQAHDDVLDDLSALAVVATDQMVYGSGAGTFAYTTVTSFARGLLDDADAATMQQTLNLEPGVDIMAYDAGLDALSTYNTDGILVQTADNTFVGRAIAASTVAGDEGISLVNGDGVSGNPTVGLDITGLTAEAGTASGSDVLALFDGTNNVKLSLTQLNAALVAIGTALNDLSDVTAPTSGLTTGVSYVLKADSATSYNLETLELADLGDVTSANASTVDGNINVFRGDGTDFDVQRLTLATDLSLTDNTTSVELSVDDVFLRNTGDTLDAGTLTVAGGASINAATGSSISMVDAPTLDIHVTNKGYVDALVSGLTWKNSAVAATTANIADLGAGAPNVVDGVTLAAGDRVLVKAQTAAEDNGIYVVDTLGTGSNGAWSRVTDMDSLTPIDEVNAAAVWVEEGTVYADTGWTVTSQVATLGTDAINWTQFNGAAGITAGTGLLKTGNTLDVNMGAGIIALPSDEVGIDLYATNNPLLLTIDGTSASTATGAQLHLRYDDSTIGVDTGVLEVKDQGITAVQLASAVAGLGIAGGNGTALSLDPSELTATATVGGDFLVLGDASASEAPIKRTITDFLADHNIQTTIAATDGIVNNSNSIELDIGALTNAAVTGSAVFAFNGSDTAGGAATHNKRSFDEMMDDLDIVHGLSGNGFAVQTAADTYVARSIAVSGAGDEAGLVVADGDGVSGNPTLGLDINGTAALNADPALDDSLIMYDLDGIANVKVTVQELANTIGAATELNELSDVEVTDYTAGDVLVADGADSYDQTTVQYTFEATGVAKTSYTITHALGQYVSVTVLDASTNDVIIPNSITMNATGGGETVITLSSALLIKAVIIGFGPAVSQTNYV